MERIEAFTHHRALFNNMYNEYIPLLVDGQLLALDLQSSVHHKHLFDAVTRGLPIQTKLGAAEEKKRIESMI